MRFFTLLTRGRRGPKPFLPYTAFSKLFFALGLFLTALFSLLYTAEKQPADWPTAEGAVSTSRVVIQSGKSVLDFEYRFTVGGKAYRGRAITQGQDNFLGEWASDSINPAKMVAKYPAQSPVTVYYEPGNPSKSILERGLSRFAIGGLALGITLMVLGVWLFFKRPFREMDKLEHYEQNIRVR